MERKKDEQQQMQKKMQTEAMHSTVWYECIFFSRSHLVDLNGRTLETLDASKTGCVCVRV